MLSQLFRAVLVLLIVFAAAWIGCGDDDDDSDDRPLGDDDDDAAGDDDDSGDNDDDASDDDSAGDDDFGDDDNVPDGTSIVFIHHSVGSTWIADGGLQTGLENAGFDFYDITYGEGTDSFGDNTDIPDWTPMFQQHYDEILSWELSGGGTHDVVMIKSCFPNSNIWSDSELDQAKGHFNSLLAIFEDHPETGFLVMTPPPYANNGEAPADAITRGRKLAHWLRNDWAKNKSNVRVVDLAGYLNDDQGFTHDRVESNAAHFFLRDECEVSDGDSHPTGTCLSAATPETVSRAATLGGTDD